jgi:hypothetical protein
MTNETTKKLRDTLQQIVDADWRKWEELASPEEFVRWAKSRAQHVLATTQAQDEPAQAQEPFAYFQWNSGWNHWEQVIDSAVGEPGVVAAYRAPVVTPAQQEAAGEIQPTYFVRHPDDSYSEANPQPVAASLLKRALNQLKRWQDKYGEHEPQWLPPAGAVILAEDIDEYLASIPSPAPHPILTDVADWLESDEGKAAIASSLARSKASADALKEAGKVTAADLSEPYFAKAAPQGAAQEAMRHYANIDGHGVVSMYRSQLITFARALSRTATPEDEITNDQCIELAEHLQRELFKKHITEVKAIAGRMNECPFSYGMESALEELEARLSMLPEQTQQIMDVAAPPSQAPEPAPAVSETRDQILDEVADSFVRSFASDDRLDPAYIADCIRCHKDDSVYRALARTAPVVPEGYALVPIEPTDQMIKAGKLYAHGCDLWLNNRDAKDVYTHMLSAAPSTQQGEQT